MITEFIRALFLIFMAEMGDKTQILAMSFATQFSVKSVLFGVFIGSFLNHGLAVILGTCLSSIIPVNFIQVLAGFLFIGFALWTLYDEDEENESGRKSRFGPVLTVALAFFIGELGDKTQLTAITLSIDARYPFFILLGTVTGMVLTSVLGIYVGSKLADKISEFTLRIVSAAIFMFFGVSKLYSTLPKNFLTLSNVLIFILLIATSTYMILKKSLRKRKN
ncbi:TMEM165/GDT1 family protein [Caloranaerobacter sp. DY30410]|uniref:TMEM165/GDT1 family protein n=1 Tax=Caloranaerobacter sp. DY30410 TaxID=3238305 RepID=UPI003CFE433E